jgi:4-hydroxy-3-methylbut-2-enyl diphosphate reductase
MAEVVIAQEAGACYGVERALQLVREAAAATATPIYTLGPLIHNPPVVRELEEQGVSVVDSPRVEAGSTLVLRTHGVAPQVERAALEAGATVLDATCPFVKRAHRAAERLEREGYQVLVVGEAGHPEVEGTVGHAPSATVVGSVGDLDALSLRKKVGVVVQTTQAKANLRDVVAALVGRVDELSLIDTICESTAGHQGACASLAATVDVMVVVGGKNSANTTHLADISREICARTYHIETADELDVRWFEGAGRIGITAGASTPASQIEMVRDAICAMVA